MANDSLDLSHATFEGLDKLKVFAVINHHSQPSLSLPQSIKLLTNLRTVRLKEWDLGDISFITSLTGLEVLDLQRCRLKELPNEMGELKKLKMLDISFCNFEEENYNGTIGKCLQLEELYALLCDHNYLSQISMDIVTHSNLRRFVIPFDPLVEPELFTLIGDMGTLHLEKFDLSKLRASERNLLQIAYNVSLSSCFYGGCKNIIPDLIGVVGCMNNLSTLNLHNAEKIECIIDATADSNLVASHQVEDLIPRLVWLELRDLTNLKEVCRGPPLHVLQFFEKLEYLSILNCPQLCSIFPIECNLQNLNILIIQNWDDHNDVLGEALFSTSVAQSLQQLETLSIAGFDALKHIIASGTENGSNTSKELIPAQRNSASVMPNLKKFYIDECPKLKSLFPICCAEGLVKLQALRLRDAPELEYVFGECDHEDRSSHQYQNQIMLPDLKVLVLIFLENHLGMCPESYTAMWSSPLSLNVEDCPNFDEGLFGETITSE